MFAIAALVVGLICALTSRALLTVAAFSISVWWGLGVFLPFGPAVFRYSYPDQAHGSRVFGLATIPFFFLFIALGGFRHTADMYHRDLSRVRSASTQGQHYALEKSPKSSSKGIAVAPTPAPTPTLNERRAANAKEFQRLSKWNDALRLRKRDLLRSDVEGNRIYVVDLALYNQALTKATAEKEALATAK